MPSPLPLSPYFISSLDLFLNASLVYELSLPLDISTQISIIYSFKLGMSGPVAPAVFPVLVIGTSVFLVASTKSLGVFLNISFFPHTAHPLAESIGSTLSMYLDCSLLITSSKSLPSGSWIIAVTC